ncbi:hypothetical protein TcasGA2_TC016412 [Tribolium castaneum]|uniref:Uncharacterized protein n=1 Tax=Tribolium castaneum TaxID=7070 RepID=D7EIX9_TRICA|nr:hypothetical protein TcasGA2_TC016412 [Tribolium castaneum]
MVELVPVGQVRNQLHYNLPHEKTLARWYSAVNCSAGFTKEAPNLIKIKAKTMFQENGSKLFGFVNMGIPVEGEQKKDQLQNLIVKVSTTLEQKLENRLSDSEDESIEVTNQAHFFNRVENTPNDFQTPNKATKRKISETNYQNVETSNKYQVLHNLENDDTLE